MGSLSWTPTSPVSPVLPWDFPFMPPVGNCSLLQCATSENKQWENRERKKATVSDSALMATASERLRVPLSKSTGFWWLHWFPCCCHWMIAWGLGCEIREIKGKMEDLTPSLTSQTGTRGILLEFSDCTTVITFTFPNGLSSGWGIG